MSAAGSRHGGELVPRPADEEERGPLDDLFDLEERRVREEWRRRTAYAGHDGWRGASAEDRLVEPRERASSSGHGGSRAYGSRGGHDLAAYDWGRGAQGRAPGERVEPYSVPPVREERERERERLRHCDAASHRQSGRSYEEPYMERDRNGPGDPDERGRGSGGGRRERGGHRGDHDWERGEDPRGQGPAGRAGGASRRRSKMVWGEHKITLQNVPLDMVGLELRELAEGYAWKSLTFARTYKRGSVNFGMLEFSDRADMLDAMKTFDGRMIEGATEKLRVYEGDNYNM